MQAVIIIRLSGNNNQRILPFAHHSSVAPLLASPSVRSYNSTYLASVLRTSATNPRSARTSDTRQTLSAIVSKRVKLRMIELYRSARDRMKIRGNE